jgi:nucleoside-diphosphate-sugar epimerase
MSRTALVAGAAGFLGSHLVDKLLLKGWTVIGVDNLSSGRADNLRDARRNPRFHLLQADLGRSGRLPAAELVIQLASPASPSRYMANAIGTLEVNGFGTARLLEHAHRNSARFLLGSTSEVYGDPEVHPQSEAYWGHVNPTGPRSCYDEGKRFAEALTMAWHRERGVDTRIARIFNTYGPRMRLDDGRAIPTFLRQGLLGEPITLEGRGRQTRSFCYVDDLIDGLLRLADAKNLPDPVNLGNPKGELSLIDLARLIRKMTGNRSRIVFVPRAPDDPERRRPNIRRAQTLLSWRPVTSLHKGLVATAQQARIELGLGG